MLRVHNHMDSRRYFQAPLGVKGLFGKTLIGFSSILQCTETIKAYLVKHELASLAILQCTETIKAYLVKHELASLAILQCTETVKAYFVKRRLPFLPSYGVKPPLIHIITHCYVNTKFTCFRAL